MLKILLVDDEAEERNGIAYLIKKYGYPLEIAEAVNGQKAHEYMMEHPIDILFTDVKMPYKDGLTLAKEVYTYNPDIKIVIFSAYGEFEYAKKALEANAVDYLLKPIELDEFQKVMEKVMGSIKKRTETEEQELLYRFFSRRQLKEEEKKKLEKYLFSEGKRNVLTANLESMGNLFEQEEDRFLQLLAMYVKTEVAYINLYPNESVLVFYGEKPIHELELKGQLEKLIRDVDMVFSEQLSIVLGIRAKHILQLEEEIEKMQEIRTGLFGCFQQIYSLSEGKNREYYAKETEVFKHQLMDAARGEHYEVLSDLAGQLVESLEKGNMVSRIYVEHLFYEILSAIYEKLPETEKEGVYKSLHKRLECRGNQELMEQFLCMIQELKERLLTGKGETLGVAPTLIRMIEREYGGDLSLDYLAEQVHLAPAYVSYMFKQETGETIVKYITDFRMERAKHMLEDGTLKIVQVAQACGYENQSYFNRLFKNYFGMTPKQFREKPHA